MYSLKNCSRPRTAQRHSRRLLGLAFSLLVLAPVALGWSGSAAGQDRNGTNPLDIPKPAPAATAGGPPPTPAPVAPVAPAGTPLPKLPAATALPRPVPLRAIKVPTLQSLLPAQASQPKGWSEKEAVARARRVSLRKARSELQRDAADSAVSAAELSFLPNMTVGARYTRLSNITPGTIPAFDTAGCLQDLTACQSNPGGFTQQVVLQQPILNQYSLTGSIRYNVTELIGGKRLDLQAAKADAAAARAGAEAVEQDVVLDAITSYWDVVRARAQLKLAADSHAVARRRADEARTRLAQGLVTNVELLQALGEEARSSRLTTLATSRVAVAETAFRHTFGVSPTQPILLNAKMTERPRSARTKVPVMVQKALGQSPDLAAAQAQADAANARVASRESRLYPALTAGFNVNYDNPNQRIFPQQEKFTATWDLSVQLSWSIDGTVVGVAQRDQLRSVAKAQELAITQAEQAIAQQIVVADGNLNAALLQIEAAHYQAAAALQGAHNRREQQAAGVATVTELANAEAVLLAAQLDLVDALVDAHVADAQLRRVRGLLSTPSR